MIIKISTMFILSLIIILINVDCRQKIKYLNTPVQNPQHPLVFSQKISWFNQVLDHYDYSKVTTWKQRYFYIEDYFNPAVGPVILFICGQYTCSGVPQARQWAVLIAQRLQGLVLTLQHRFYGESMPFGNQSLLFQNMKYLNSEQALRDLAYFTQQITQNKMHNVKNNPWIVMGGSYPGALAAWYRAKYPHLTIGSIASSAVINAIAQFPDFDEQMFLSANKSGQYCWKAINDSTTQVQRILSTPQGLVFKKQFNGGEQLSDTQFLFFWSDGIVEPIQYGRRTNLCDSLKGKTPQQQLQALIQVVKQNDVHGYGAKYLSDPLYYVVNKDSSRAWMFQCCTQYGFWQTVSDRHPLRSKKIDINFYRSFCQNIFERPIWPDTDRKNNQYGALNIQATRLLMSNGQQDPWKWASLQQSKGEIISRVANCTNCAHCVDLYTPKIEDSAGLKKIRDQQYLDISGWVEDYWRNVKLVQDVKYFLTRQ